MSLKERIDADIRQAMLARKKEELTALRGIKSMILLAETAKGAGGGLTPEAEMKVLMKAARQRRESAELYAREGRQDLADKENFEYEVIARYLPQALTEEELRQEVEAIIAETGAAGLADMGRVMGVAAQKLAGRAGGSEIAAVVREILSRG